MTGPSPTADSGALFPADWQPDPEVADVICKYLIDQPEQGDWAWEDHCDGLAGGILCALQAAGFEVSPITRSEP